MILVQSMMCMNSRSCQKKMDEDDDVEDKWAEREKTFLDYGCKYCKGSGCQMCSYTGYIGVKITHHLEGMEMTANGICECGHTALAHNEFSKEKYDWVCRYCGCIYDPVLSNNAYSLGTPKEFDFSQSSTRDAYDNPERDG